MLFYITRMHSSRMRTAHFNGHLGRGVLGLCHGEFGRHPGTPRTDPPWADTLQADTPQEGTPSGQIPHGQTPPSFAGGKKVRICVSHEKGQSRGEHMISHQGFVTFNPSALRPQQLPSKLFNFNHMTSGGSRGHQGQILSRMFFFLFHAVFGKKYAKQECIPVECVPSPTAAVSRGRGVSARGGVCWGVSAPGEGVCSGGCLLPGMVWSGGVGIPACTEADTPPCVQNDRQV